MIRHNQIHAWLATEASIPVKQAGNPAPQLRNMLSKQAKIVVSFGIASRPCLNMSLSLVLNYKSPWQFRLHKVITG